MNVNSITLWLVLCVALFQVHLLIAVPEAVVARYGSSLNWETLELGYEPVERYWRTKQEWEKASQKGEQPLSGLRIALDPGHLGGQWAEAEGRHFRMSDKHHWVREGELVLEVAQRIQAMLEPLGAEVTLVRESSIPVNRRTPTDYLPDLVQQYPMADLNSLEEQADYALLLQRESTRRAIVTDELAARARRINAEIRPDIAISLHINAVPWLMTEGGERLLSDQNHLHVLIFGAMSRQEAGIVHQQRQLTVKLADGCGLEEFELGSALASRLAQATRLPPAFYGGSNAVLCDAAEPYVWARNLHMLRAVECPIVMLEPYVANSKEGYARIQKALETRANGQAPEEEDILVEYADAVVAGILSRYAPEGN